MFPICQREQNLLDHCFDLFADFEEENYYLAETARRESWVEAESVERRCSASRWAVESSNTLLWKVILSKETQSPGKKSRRNTSWTTTYKNFMSFWAQHLFCEIANTIFKGGKSEDSFVIILSLMSWMIFFSLNILHLESTVDHWHLDPGTQLWDGTSPQSSQSPHWVETLWWWWWFKDILVILITPRHH